ncbi:MAG: hypothetical protein AAFP97_13600, partial [Pseudomonadota bacterium]
MASNIKTWTRLGLGTAVSLGALSAGCAPVENGTAPDAAEAPVAAVPVGVGGEAGETGEGEGGVAIEQAATNPVIFLSALAITEAHIIAARDAHAAGETDAAAEMFAHPVSEVLADIEPIFQARGVADFNDLLLNASSAVFDGETSEQIAARSDEIIAALRAAAEKAPDDGRSMAAVQAGVVADQIDRAADMYGIAQEEGQYEPYLDGYGFYEAARSIYEMNKPAMLRPSSGAFSAAARRAA